MCGIVGYVGNKKASPILYDGLLKLEYRGYDSARIATLENDGINISKTKGKLKELEQKVKKSIHNGGVGIGHTRWATHGTASEINSHPHKVGKITLVHNGIIENSKELKEKLQKEGVIFNSDTDTEVAAALIDYYYENDIIKAINNAGFEVDQVDLTTSNRPITPSLFLMAGTKSRIKVVP